MTYDDAYDLAVERAKASGIDQFISRSGDGGFRVEYATRPENTFGSDLMKERVTPNHPSRFLKDWNK